MSTPMRRRRSPCCARTASGQKEAELATALMKSRRRIAFPEATDCADCRFITAGICDRRNGVEGSVCTAAILRRSCPFRVRSGHFSECSSNVRFYPSKRTSRNALWMSAKCQKADILRCEKKSLFDHLVGGREERLRNGKAERLARSHNRHRLTAAHHCRARQNRRFAPRLTKAQGNGELKLLGLLELGVTYFVASLRFLSRAAETSGSRGCRPADHFTAATLLTCKSFCGA